MTVTFRRKHLEVSAMAQWTILLFSLYGVLHGKEIMIHTEQECCQDGMDWAQRGPYCILPNRPYTYTCRISQEQCCAAAVEDWLCGKGIQMSKEPSVCEESFFPGEPWETKMSKMCCDCCKLGLLTASRGSSCELPGLLLGQTCLHTAKDCCDKNTTAAIQPAATEIQLPTEQECCQGGRDWALEGQYCANLNLISSSPTCRISQEQCCAAAVEDGLCEKGIRISKEQWVCERPLFQGEPWETKMSKMCCDCCMLGLVTASRGSSCELPGLLLGKKCFHTAKACCNKNTTTEIKLAATAPVTEKPQTSVTAKPTEGLDPCIDSLCSQLCEGNGMCSCHGGYQLKKDGVNCEDVNECLTDSHNCVLGQVCINTEGSFRCQREISCGTGYELKDDTCQDIDECALETHNCEAAFLCNNTEGSFHCVPNAECSGGFIRDAAGSCIAPVTEKPQTNVTAKPTEGLDPCIDSLCSQLCEGGYQLKKDGGNCEDVNECLTDSHNCVLGQVCINTEGSFRCQREISCGTGYELKDDNTCQDIDECALETHNCEAAFLCTNTEGSFRCVPKAECSGGFIRDAAGSCIDVNECVAHTSPCPLRQTCINTFGSYTCRRNTVTCGRGYRLTEDGSRCEDVDECRTGNVCLGHGCVNLVGTYRCECRTGYTFNSINELCEDINECRLYSGRLCSHKCENTEGSYKCSCSTGFKLTPNNRHCEDVNECDANPCNQECANVFGSYQCYCRHGYQLSHINGFTCEDIDECAVQIGGHVCSYRCSNVPGSFYCTCPPTGYTLAYNGHTCQDIDECAVGSHTCYIYETCINIQGGFRCLSFTCPQNFQEAGLGRCERVTCEFTRDPASCFLLPLRISFHNISFPTNTLIPTDIFRMGLSNSVPGDKLLLDIVSGDEEGYFVVEQHAQGGEIALRRSLSQPRDFFLTVEMRLVRYGTAHLYMAKLAVSTRHASVIGRCIKACQPNDRGCNLDPVHVITHISISPPLFRDFSKPREIVSLQTVAATYHATDVFFDILLADDPLSFDVVKRYEHGKVVGVVRQVKSIRGPKDLMLEVAMNYVKSRHVSHRDIAVISVFIPEFLF